MLNKLNNIGRTLLNDILHSIRANYQNSIYSGSLETTILRRQLIAQHIQPRNSQQLRTCITKICSNTTTIQTQQQLLLNSASIETVRATEHFTVLQSEYTNQKATADATAIPHRTFERPTRQKRNRTDLANVV